MDDLHFMKQAIAEARKAYDINEVPVGCVIVCNNRIIARGHNLTETLNDSTAHAEIQAITSASNFLGSKYLNECTLYVSLEPCIMCAGALAWTHIMRIVFAAFDNKKGYHLYNPNPLHPKTQVSGGILEEESSILLADFFRSKRG